MKLSSEIPFWLFVLLVAVLFITAFPAIMTIFAIIGLVVVTGLLLDII